MKLVAKIDSQLYSNAIAAFQRELKADSVLLLKEEMRLLLRDIVRFTPPFSYQQGRNAIKGDLFGGKKKSNARGTSIGLFQRIGQSKLAVPERARHAGAATYAVNLGWENSKNVRIFKKFWRPNASLDEMRTFYKRFQNSKTGRPGYVSHSEIGRHKVQDQMWVSDQAANKMFAYKSARVGIARAGWARAAIGVGLKLPNWVMRHIAYAPGGYSAPSVQNLEIEAINRASKIPNYFRRHVMPAAMARVKSVRAELERLLHGGKSRRASLANTKYGRTS